MKTIILLLFPLFLQAQPIKVAIIDSGLTTPTQFNICEDMSYDFMADKPQIGIDEIGHGSNIVSLISSEAANISHCFIIYKIFSKNEYNGKLGAAIQHANLNGADIINISITGNGFSESEFEALNVSKAFIFIAAGNEKINFHDDFCPVYPACYKKLKNMFVIGAKANYTNRGKQVDLYLNGCYNNMCGTSQATARATGKFVKFLDKQRGKR